ncbi:MAG: AsmA family protein [Bryobacterales bacterium]|nr:AsmA family protein [Bryobacterales bacterium]
MKAATVRRALLALVALVLVAGLAAPFFRGDRFAGRIRNALEEGLGRRVEIGEVRFNLFTGPGFTLSNVVIHEDPAIGIEPLAYVTEMDARVGLWSLVTGRLEFSTLRLIEPSVNLAKPEAGSWNLQPLLARAAASARSPGAKTPAIQVRNGRFNFKFGDVKSVFYLSAADLDITPSAGAAEFRFDGEPARTDRGAQGFGRLSGRGRWRPAAGQEFEVDLSLDRSNVGEIARLFHGHDVGMHGLVASRARLTGPLSDIRVSGRLQLEDVHRWDLMPQRGREWPVDYRGRIDLAAQTVELETVPPPGQPMPVSVRFRALDLLSQPRWAAVFTVRQLPVAGVVEVARHFGAALPKQLSLEGSLEGAIGFSLDSGLQGQVLVRDVSLSAPDAPELKIERARIEVDRDRVHAAPFTVETGAGRAAQVEADFRTGAQTLEVLVATRGLAAGDLRSASEMFGAPPIPLLAACEDGTWKGWVRYRREGAAEGLWTGAVELLGVKLAVDGLSEPVLLRSASAQIDGGKLVLSRLRAQAGQIAFEGEYRHEDGAARPDRFRFSVPEAGAAELERVFAPTLRRQGGLIARTLGLVRAGVPDWLAARRAEGSIEIGTLTAQDLRWEKLKARLAWTGPAIEVAELVSVWSQGKLKAKGSISLASVLPVYRLQGRLDGFSWRGAAIDVNGRLETVGSGVELLQNLKSAGTFSAADVPLSEDLECLFTKGRYEIFFRRGAPQLKLASLEVALGDEIYQGQGATLADGRLGVDLTDGKKWLRLTGRLAPFRLEPAPK